MINPAVTAFTTLYENLYLSPVNYNNLSDLGKTAVAYARQGLLVFPKVPGGKAAMLSGGQNIASNDEDTIARLWLMVPNANIGIATGIPKKTGLLARDPLYVDVVDFDSAIKNGKQTKNGIKELSRWIDANFHCTAIAEARTRHGGVHLYYPASGLRSGVLESGHVDFLATGGSVTAPGSVVAVDRGVNGKGRYYWHKDAPIRLPLTEKAAPAPWESFLNLHGQVLDRTYTGGKTRTAEEVEAQIMDTIESEFAPGNRDNPATRIAYKAVANDLPDDAISRIHDAIRASGGDVDFAAKIASARAKLRRDS